MASLPSPGNGAASSCVPLPPETTSTGLLSGGLFGSSRDIVETVQLLWQAADDPRIVGLYVEIGDEEGGLARVQELRQAIAHFRGKGKFAIGFAGMPRMPPRPAPKPGEAPKQGMASMLDKEAKK